jgi:acyl-CoA dehydrogenase
MFSFLIKMIKKNNLLPKISDTEREALNAGNVWVEGEFFTGRPDFKRIMSEVYPQLTEEEQAFLDGPVEDVCNMVKVWDITQAKRVPEHVWAFLKKHRFFGLLIPKEHGGHGFSALASSAVIGKLNTHSMTLNSVVLIPNSIGPGELLTHYGTASQKKHYLPRLAAGDEMPAFALTEPRAGSDAASMTSSGVLFRDAQGKLKIRLNWSKRYITLAPISTLLGLAFRLYDPDNHLGQGQDVGITCALVPTNLEGVEVGRRHDPMGCAFPNGPTKGNDVVIDAESQIIGGLEWAGRGWHMLMEALSGGRAISLPAGAASGAKAVARAVGAYAALRQQFGRSIGQFEGIEEPLARIAGSAYIMEAARIYTCGAVDSGNKPSITSAIAKYHQTEMIRKVLNDGMDILGGKGISKGPRNLLAEGYTTAPIAITVEGANILTRTLIIFGQGALRCHPYLQREVAALENDDAKEFRSALIGHILYVIRNFFLTVLYTLTRGWVALAGPISGPTVGYVKKLKWASAMYAFLSDLTVAGLGPKLKQRGKIAGRFADVLSWMYLAAATLRRYEAEGQKEEDLALVHYSMQTALYEIQKGFEGIFQNFEFPIFGGFIRSFGAFVISANPIARPPSDELGGEVARILMVPSQQRDRLTWNTWVPADKSEPHAVLERAFQLHYRSLPVLKIIKKAIRAGELPKKHVLELLEAALEKKIISSEQAQLIRDTEAARDEVLTVDDFSPEEYFRHSKKFDSQISPEMAVASA